MTPTTLRPFLLGSTDLPPGSLSIRRVDGVGLCLRSPTTLVVLKAVEHLFDEAAVPADRGGEEADDVHLHPEEQEGRPGEQGLDVPAAIALGKEIQEAHERDHAQQRAEHPDATPDVQT